MATPSDERADLERQMDDAARSGDTEALDRIIRRHAELTSPEPGTTARPAAPAAPRAVPAAPRRSAVVPRAPDTLPAVWGEDRRALPNPLLRAALFTIRRDPVRRKLDDVAIPSTLDVRIFYSGEELRIRDEDVLLQVCHFQRQVPVGTPFRASTAAYLHGLGWGDGLRAREDLYTSLRRLAKGHITILRSSDDGPILEDVHLLDLSTQLYGQGDITLVVPRSTLTLWTLMGYTLLDWRQRTALKKPLSRWLQGYYSTHRTPYPVRVDTLHQLTGSSTASLARFRQALRDALAELQGIGFLLGYWIDAGDRVCVTRAPATALPGA